MSPDLLLSTERDNRRCRVGSEILNEWFTFTD
jgi:hypothetical protein